MMLTIEHSEFDDFSPSLRSVLLEVPNFPNKSAALSEGKNYGWTSAIRIKKRFEWVWVVGKKDFQDDEIADSIAVECLKFPLLKWERDSRGIEYVPVVTCRRPAQ